jgi:hypothetical protein
MSAIAVNDQGVMKRPRANDECVLRRAAELALPEVKVWLGNDGSPDSEVIEDLMETLGEIDGFAIADRLQHRKHWDCDSRLVDILNGNFVSDAQDELEKQWVKCLGITLDIPVGAQVKIKRLPRGLTDVTGEVVKHYPESAKYGVRTPEQPKTSNWILLPEDIESI